MRRRGITLTETVCAAVILSVVCVVVPPALRLVARQQETSDERLEAGALVANLLDELCSGNGARLAVGESPAVEIPEWAQEQLADATATAEVFSADPGLRVTVTVSWRPSHGGSRQDLSMSSWVFAGGQP